MAKETPEFRHLQFGSMSIVSLAVILTVTVLLFRGLIQQDDYWPVFVVGGAFLPLLAVILSSSIHYIVSRLNRADEDE